MFRKNRLNFLIIGISLVILIGYALFVDRPEKLLLAFQSAKQGWIWLLGAGSCMLLYWFLESFSLYAVTQKLRNSRLSFRGAVQTSMVGQLFNCITPFASGGQPIQAYYMVKYGLSPGSATSALLVKFILYQSVLTIYSLVMLLLKFRFFAFQISGFRFLVFVGFLINAAVVVALACIGFFPRFTKKTVLRLVCFLEKRRWLRKEGTADRILGELDSFAEGFAYLKKNILLILKVSVLMAFQLTAYFAVPYFICRALQATNVDFITVLAAGAFVLMISSFVPLPGAAGGAEGSFYLFFGMFFPQASVIAVAVLIWRGITFYFPIVAGMCFSNQLPDKLCCSNNG